MTGHHEMAETMIDRHPEMSPIMTARRDGKRAEEEVKTTMTACMMMLLRRPGINMGEVARETTMIRLCAMTMDHHRQGEVRGTSATMIDR